MANSRWRFFRPKSKQEFNEQKKKNTLWSVTSKCLTELFPQNTYLLVRIIIEVCIHKTVEDWFFCINFTFSINLRCCIDIFNDCTFISNAKMNCTHEHKREACERERKKSIQIQKINKKRDCDDWMCALVCTILQLEHDCYLSDSRSSMHWVHRIERRYYFICDGHLVFVACSIPALTYGHSQTSCLFWLYDCIWNVFLLYKNSLLTVFRS